jgi:hypothetical protein
MREITIHCPARGHEVRVLVTDDPVWDGQASIDDPELLCLEIGERCTRAACPVCGESPTAMDAHLAKRGLGPPGRARVLGRCDGCDRTTELALSAGGYATCVECGTTQRLEPFPH